MLLATRNGSVGLTGVLVALYTAYFLVHAYGLILGSYNSDQISSAGEATVTVTQQRIIHRLDLFHVLWAGRTIQTSMLRKPTDD